MRRVTTAVPLSDQIAFCDAPWGDVPDAPGVCVIYDREEIVYVGMAGRNGRGSLRNRLRDHYSRQIVSLLGEIAKGLRGRTPARGAESVPSFNKELK